MPSIINIRKKRIAQPTDPGNVAMASGYTTNTRPGPEAINAPNDLTVFDIYMCACVWVGGLLFM